MESQNYPVSMKLDVNYFVQKLNLHLINASYQAAIWQCCFQPKPIDMDHGPNGHEWKVEYSDISIVWMIQPPAPDAILALISCACKSGCSTNKRQCLCVKQGLPCTDACKCNDCMNRNDLPTNSDTDTGEDTDI